MPFRSSLTAPCWLRVDPMLDRLQAVLTALRYDKVAKPTVRINLLFGIMAHAMDRGDEEMRAACETEIKAIRPEIPTPQPPIRPIENRT